MIERVDRVEFGIRTIFGSIENEIGADITERDVVRAAHSGHIPGPLSVDEIGFVRIAFTAIDIGVSRAMDDGVRLMTQHDGGYA